LRKPSSGHPAHGTSADDANPHAAPFRGSGARMKSRTGAICSSLINHGACPTPGNSTNSTRGPPTRIRLTVDSSRRSDSAPRSTSVGHSTWSQVECPTLVLRGAESDLLLESTVRRMRVGGPRVEFVEFPGVGHAPWLMSEEIGTGACREVGWCA